jgi:transposase
MTDLPVISRESLSALDKDRLIDIILFLVEENARLKKRIDELEARLNANSSNSSRPPSSDSPFAKPTNKVSGKKGKPGAKKGHKGTRYQMLEPTKQHDLLPTTCTCGNRKFTKCEPYYTHQHLELPEVRLSVTHFTLHRGECSCRRL